MKNICEDGTIGIDSLNLNSACNFFLQSNSIIFFFYLNKDIFFLSKKCINALGLEDRYIQEDVGVHGIEIALGFREKLRRWGEEGARG